MALSDIQMSFWVIVTETDTQTTCAPFKHTCVLGLIDIKDNLLKIRQWEKFKFFEYKIT